MKNEIDLSGSWDKVWSAVSGDSTITTLAAIVGVILVLAAIGGFIWRKARGKGSEGAGRGLILTLLIGAILAAPSVVLPLLLGLADLLINTGIRLYNQAK